MQLVTLGTFELSDVPFRRVKPLLLLTFTVVEGRRDRRHLAELFWPGAPDPLNNLSAALKQLRQYAPGTIEGNSTHVWSMANCDASMFLQAAESGDHRQALDLYRGPFLRDLYIPGWGTELEEWVYSTREFLGARARHVWLQLADGMAATGNFEEASKCAEAAYLLPGGPELEPEELAKVHILLAAGNSPHLGRLRHDARNFGIDLLMSPAEARLQLQRLSITSTSLLKTNLPSRGTAFIGRDVEIAEISNQLEKLDCSLLTLTGPGGVGKSRLALCVAHSLSGRPLDAYFVPLEALNEVNLIPSSIAGALSLSLQSTEDPLVQVARHIGNQSTLLVLDNYEHLLDGTAMVSQLLHACPHLKVLVTSRERLNLEEEWVLPLTGLAVPPPDVLFSEALHHDAINLFVERAKRARLSFELTLQELPHVVSICRQVQGLPLGIELAAAWVRLLSCQAITQEIGRTTELLISSSRSVPERHKSIKTVFEHSFRLLSSKEQDVLRKLSVFQGGFSRDAAAEVAGATISVLASLMDKSLLSVTPGGRYEFHPLLHRFTREKLQLYSKETWSTNEKHYWYYLALAEQAEAQFTGPDVLLWVERLAEEHDNLREALNWTEESSQAALGLRLAGAVRPFWEIRNYLSEGRERLSRLLSRSAVAEPTPVRATALYGAGRLARFQGEYDVARQFLEEGLSISRQLENTLGVAVGLRDLGQLDSEHDDGNSARPLLEESLTIRQTLGEPWDLADSLRVLGYLAIDETNYSLAYNLLEESLAIYRMLGEQRGLATSLLGLSYVAIEVSDYAKAHSLLQEGMAVYRDIAYQRKLALFMEAFAALYTAEGRPGQAASVYGAAEKLREAINAPLSHRDYRWRQKYLQVVHAQLDEEHFMAAWAEGLKRPLEQTIVDIVNGN